MKLNAKDRVRFKRLVERTKRHATRTGMRWDDDEVERVMRGIEHDETTYEMAMAIGRSYYALQTARSHIRFAMDHAAVLYTPPARKRPSDNVTSIRKARKA